MIITPDFFLRYQRISIVFITLLAAALRIYSLNIWPIYGDEVHTINHIINWNEHVIISPLAYLPISFMIELFGDRAWALRLWPCAIGIITIPISYILIKRLTNNNLALWSSFLLSISPWHIAQSQNARHYPLQMLLGIILIYYVYNAIEKNSRVHYAMSALFSLLMILTRMSSVFMLSLIICYIVLILLWGNIRPKKINFNRLFLFLLYIIILLIFAIGVGSSSYGSTAKPWGNSIIYILLSSAYYITLPLIICALIATYIALKEKNRLMILMSVYAFIPIALVSFSSYFRPSTSLVAFISLPGIIILSAWLIDKISMDIKQQKNKLMLTSLGFVLSASLITNSIEYFGSSNGYRPDMENAAKYINTEMSPRDKVFYVGQWGKIGMEREFSKLGRDIDVEVLFDKESFNNILSIKNGWIISEDTYSLKSVNEIGRGWLDKNTHLKTYIPSFIGPRSRSLWIYKLK